MVPGERGQIQMPDPETDSTGKKLAKNSRAKISNPNREKKTMAKMQTTLDSYKFQVANANRTAEGQASMGDSRAPANKEVEVGDTIKTEVKL